MAEFLTMQEAEDKFGKKGRTNAALTLRRKQQLLRYAATEDSTHP